MKKILSYVLAVALLLPVGIVSAADEHDALVGQINAIGDYLRLYYDLDTTDPISNDEMRTSIADGVAWFKNAQEDSGHFKYEYLPFSDEYRDDDHMVRQAGGLYQLGEIAWRDTEGELAMGEVIEPAIDYLASISPEDEVNGTSIRCITRSETSRGCDLGASALALTGVLGYVKANPELRSQYADLIDSYANYILLAKKPDAGFRDKYVVGNGFFGENESPFSNGEALLALVRYYEYEPNEAVRTVIDDTFAYLSDLEFESPLYLWIMAALKDMHTLWPNEAYTTYGKAFTDWRLERSIRRHGTLVNYCAPSEGLVSAYSLLEHAVSPAELATLRAEIDYWNAHHQYWQIDTNDSHRLVRSEDMLTMHVVEDMDIAAGGWLTSEEQLAQRIDFTQHCLSNYVQTLVDIEGEAL